VARTICAGVAGGIELPFRILKVDFGDWEIDPSSKEQTITCLCNDYKTWKTYM
jgi:hypothetical protein